MARTEFEFRGFVPCSADEMVGRSVLERIEELAPYEALSSGTIERVEEHYTVSIEVRTHDARFESQGKGQSLCEALAHAEGKLKRHLADWRRHRFGGTQPGLCDLETSEQDDRGMAA